MNIKYRGGSEWRKWDLHIHTPASVLNNGFGSDWDSYVQKLFSILIEKEIAAVGITDYFTIDGYKKIKEEYLSNEAKLATLFTPEEIEKIKGILVLPNIEFRSDIFVEQKSVNFHILFSEDVSIKDIEEHFLHEISFRYEGDPQQPDRYRKLTPANIAALGARLLAEHSEFAGNSDIYVGMMNAVVDDSKISQLLYEKESIFGEKYVFVTMADEDLSAISWNGRDHLTRKALVQKSDLLFSSNPKTINWAVGKPPYSEGSQKFVSEFKTLKACIHGSDAHSYAFIAYPCTKRGVKTHKCFENPADCDLRFCWIKADPTFEGLRQVMYEPEDRIKIQSADPTPFKSSQTILEFAIKDIKIEDELHIRETILPMNKGLIAVTGGKGSGKTAIVDLLANNYENRQRSNDKNSFVKRISTNSPLETRLSLVSGVEISKKVGQGTLLDSASIIYLAQGELEKHVEDPTHLEAFINNLIFQSTNIKDSELLFDFDNKSQEVEESKQRLHSSNSLIAQLEKETDVKIDEELKKEEKKYITDLADTQKKIKDLAKELSAEAIKEAEEKQKHLTLLRDRKTLLTDLGLAMKEALRFIDEDVLKFNNNIDAIIVISTKLGTTYNLQQLSYSDIAKIQEAIPTLRDDLRNTITDIEKFQKDLDEKAKGVKEHTKLLDTSRELEKAIEKVKLRIADIQSKKNALKERLSDRNVIFKEFIEGKIELKKQYLKIIATFSSSKNDILSDLDFGVELLFDKTRFLDTMSELVDLRKLKIWGSENSDSEIGFFTDAMADLATNSNLAIAENVSKQQIEKLLNVILPNQKRAETLNRLTVYDAVFGDYLTVVPSVKYKKVKLSKLSLGQKATVLIKIYLAQGENPIIIDSHDDHLDNEFIMEELVKALRQAKQYRQVIIVSNNGNMVVNSDAEQVIIANRDDSGNITYVSGSLENPEIQTKLLLVLEGGEDAFDKRKEKYRIK